MEQFLLSFGLSVKEARFYLFLVEEGSMTAAEIAVRLKESRTNTYMVLEKLTTEELVETDDTMPVRRYRAADPAVFRERINRQMRQIKQTNAAINSVLPELTSLFNMTQHKPGVSYLEGLNGFKALLEDNARLKEGTIDLLASNVIQTNSAAWDLLQRGIAKRAAKGIRTRGLFYSTDQNWDEIKKFEKRGYEVRRWGKEPLLGEIVIYGSKIAITVYQPSLIVTVITNDVMAQTFRVIFEQLWQSATTQT